MKIRLCVLTFLISVFALAANAISLQRILDFESANFDGWSLKRLPVREHAVIITDPVRAGKYAAAVSLAPGVTYKGDWKSELSDQPIHEFDQEIWYRVSHYIPQDFEPQSDNSCVLAQWHNSAVLGFSPLLAHRYQNGVMKVTIAYGTADIPLSYDDVVNKTWFEFPFAKNQWHDFVYRTRWSRGGLGLIQAWHNGKFIATYEGPTGYKNDEGGPYFKAGVYCENSPDKILTVYLDEYRRGARKEDVLLPGELLELP